MAKNRYGWQKRAKELARKQKNDDKMKRRQSKIGNSEVQDSSDLVEDVMTDPDKTTIPPLPSQQD